MLLSLPLGLVALLLPTARADAITLDTGAVIQGDLARFEFGGSCQISVTEGDLTGVIVTVPCQRVTSFVRTNPNLPAVSRDEGAEAPAVAPPPAAALVSTVAPADGAAGVVAPTAAPTATRGAPNARLPGVPTTRTVAAAETAPLAEAPRSEAAPPSEAAPQPEAAPQASAAPLADTAVAPGAAVGSATAPVVAGSAGAGAPSSSGPSDDERFAAALGAGLALEAPPELVEGSTDAPEARSAVPEDLPLGPVAARPPASPHTSTGSRLLDALEEADPDEPAMGPTVAIEPMPDAPAELAEPPAAAPARGPSVAAAPPPGTKTRPAALGGAAVSGWNLTAQPRPAPSMDDPATTPLTSTNTGSTGPTAAAGPAAALPPPAAEPAGEATVDDGAGQVLEF